MHEHQFAIRSLQSKRWIRGVCAGKIGKLFEQNSEIIRADVILSEGANGNPETNGAKSHFPFRQQPRCEKKCRYVRKINRRCCFCLAEIMRPKRNGRSGSQTITLTNLSLSGAVCPKAPRSYFLFLFLVIPNDSLRYIFHLDSAVGSFFAYINYRFVKLPSAIGLMLIAALDLGGFDCCLVSSRRLW